MAPMNWFTRRLSVSSARMSTRVRRSTKWARRRRPRLKAPPATKVSAEDVHHGVLEIRLMAGERRNVLGRTTIDEIERLVGGPPHGTKVIVITAEPPDFCAGYDFIEASNNHPESLIAHEDNFRALRSSPIPIVVALQGNVIGGGVELALSADIRIASPETRLAIPAGKIGLVYSEAGIRLVVETLGDSVARALFLAGREINADAALAMGIVTEVVGREQLRERALELGANIASWSATAATGNRQILDVIAGRISADTDALHALSFEPRSDLSTSIANFVARRSRTVTPIVPVVQDSDSADQVSETRSNP
jgi:enoyl-CoA hydratase/carnithine racemase